MTLLLFTDPVSDSLSSNLLIVLGPSISFLPKVLFKRYAFVLGIQIARLRIGKQFGNISVWLAARPLGVYEVVTNPINEHFLMK